MQVTEGDSLTQLAVIGQVRNIKKQLPDAEIEVVCHANSLDMLLKSVSKVAAHIPGLQHKMSGSQHARIQWPGRRQHGKILSQEQKQFLQDSWKSSLNKRKDGLI